MIPVIDIWISVTQITKRRGIAMYYIAITITIVFTRTVDAIHSESKKLVVSAFLGHKECKNVGDKICNKMAEMATHTVLSADLRSQFIFWRKCKIIGCGITTQNV